MPWVVDASALVEVLLSTENGAKIASIAKGEELLAPDLVNAEVISTLRRLVATGGLGPDDATRAVDDLVRAPIERVVTDTLLTDVWSMREWVSPYDACYVALARAVGCGLVTMDHRLARAHGLGVAIVTP